MSRRSSANAATSKAMCHVPSSNLNSEEVFSKSHQTKWGVVRVCNMWIIFWGTFVWPVAYDKSLDYLFWHLNMTSHWRWVVQYVSIFGTLQIVLRCKHDGGQEPSRGGYNSTAQLYCRRFGAAQMHSVCCLLTSLQCCCVVILDIVNTELSPHTFAWSRNTTFTFPTV